MYACAHAQTGGAESKAPDLGPPQTALLTADALLVATSHPVSILPFSLEYEIPVGDPVGEGRVPTEKLSFFVSLVERSRVSRLPPARQAEASARAFRAPPSGRRRPLRPPRAGGWGVWGGAAGPEPRRVGREDGRRPGPGPPPACLHSRREENSLCLLGRWAERLLPAAETVPELRAPWAELALTAPFHAYRLVGEGPQLPGLQCQPRPHRNCAPKRPAGLPPRTTGRKPRRKPCPFRMASAR